MSQTMHFGPATIKTSVLQILFASAELQTRTHHSLQSQTMGDVAAVHVFPLLAYARLASPPHELLELSRGYIISSVTRGWLGDRKTLVFINAHLVDYVSHRLFVGSRILPRLIHHAQLLNILSNIPQYPVIHTTSTFRYLCLPVVEHHQSAEWWGRFHENNFINGSNMLENVENFTFIVHNDK